jgi:hypothetical protein
LRKVVSLKEEFEKIDPSLCTERQIRDALGKVGSWMEQTLGDLAYLAANGFYVQKWHKFETIEKTFSHYGDALVNIPIQLILFAQLILWGHDIGRLFEELGIVVVNNTITVPVEYKNHGRVAAYIILRRIGISLVIGPRAQKVLEYAISRHHDRILRNIGPRANKARKTAFFFAMFLRDLDKLGAFLNKIDTWLGDNGRTREMRKRYNIKGPMGEIKPRRVLKMFARRETININIFLRGGCSWEAYVLCVLAWVFDINFVETLEILARKHVIEKILAYLEKNLEDHPADYILVRDTLRDYFDEQGVAHEF